MDTLRIYYEGSSVKGIEVGYYSGFIFQKIGETGLEFQDYDLGKNKELMGFYGVSTETGISQLGPVIQDSYCTREIMRLRREAKRKNAIDEARRAQMAIIDDFYFVVLCGVVGLLLVTIGVMCCLKFLCKCFDVVDEIEDKREKLRENA